MATPITSHHDLDVWKASMRLRNPVARITNQLSLDERRGIGNQANRAAQSIPANIAEGHQRPGRADYRQYVSIARGSAAELETHLIAIGCDHPPLRDEVKEALQIQGRVSRMLAKLYAAL